jgi:outer membrane receptor protein involved in Fe transport
VFNLQGLLSGRTTNEFKSATTRAPTRLGRRRSTARLLELIINLSGSVANTGIAGQGASSGITVPGGLIRANSAQNGRAQPYDPYTLSFIDALSTLRGNHYIKVGGEFRMIRMATDRSAAHLLVHQPHAFLANQPSTIQYLGDVSAPSVFNNGATGRATSQEYYIAYAQDEWHVNPKLTLNYGARYDYYTPMREANDLEVKFNIDTGVIDPPTTPLFTSTKTNLQPRLGLTYSASDRTVLPRRRRPVRRPGPDRGSDPAGRRLGSHQHDAVVRHAGVSARHLRSPSPTS